MKKVFKKNQVIITALAIMIVIAGYLNFTSDKQVLNTSGDSLLSDNGASGNQDDANISANVEDNLTGEEFASSDWENDNSLEVNDNLMDENNDEIINESVESVDASVEETKNNEDMAEASLDENGDPINAETVGEAVLTSGAVTISEAKINREQTRAKAKDFLLEIINNENIEENSKKDAINKMLNMTENMEKENAAETQLAAKGFKDSIVSISEDSVDVTVNCSQLNDKQRTQIEDIITRKTGCELNKIVITTASVS